MSDCIPSATYVGSKPGYVFKTDNGVTGYYVDRPLADSPAEAMANMLGGNLQKYNKFPNDGTYLAKVSQMLAQKKAMGGISLPMGRWIHFSWRNSINTRRGMLHLCG